MSFSQQHKIGSKMTIELMDTDTSSDDINPCTSTEVQVWVAVIYMYVHLEKKITQIFISFSKPLRLLYSLIIYEIVNFLFSLFTLCYFFLYLKSVPIHVIVHVYVYA